MRGSNGSERFIGEMEGNGRDRTIGPSPPFADYKIPLSLPTFPEASHPRSSSVVSMDLNLCDEILHVWIYARH